MAAWCWRVQGYCWAHVANAHKVLGQLNEADRAFARAKELWQAGVGSDSGQRLEEALVLGLEASLRKDQRRLREALDLTDQALKVAPRGTLTAQRMVNKANILKLRGDYKPALANLDNVALLITEAEDPRVLCLHRFGLVDCLCHLDQPSKAEALLPELRRLVAGIDNELDRLRLRWLEARVAAGMGRRQEATTTLARVRQEFADRSMPYDTALATLELAVLYAEEERTAEVKILARQMKPIFDALLVHPEALAALRLFVAAAEQEKASATWVRSLVLYFYRAQGDLTLRFEPPS